MAGRHVAQFVQVWLMFGEPSWLITTSTFRSTGMAWPNRMQGAADSGGGGAGLILKLSLIIMHHTPQSPGLPQLIDCPLMYIDPLAVMVMSEEPSGFGPHGGGVELHMVVLTPWLVAFGRHSAGSVAKGSLSGSSPFPPARGTTLDSQTAWLRRAARRLSGELFDTGIRKFESPVDAPPFEKQLEIPGTHCAVPSMWTVSPTTRHCSRWFPCNPIDGPQTQSCALTFRS